MKLKSKLLIAFATITILPVILTVLAAVALGMFQMKSIENTYGISGTSYESFSNSIQVFNHVTETICKEIKTTASQQPDEFKNEQYLEKLNQKLEAKKSFLIVRKGETVTYTGMDRDTDTVASVIDQLPEYGEQGNSTDSGTYLGGDAQALVKQVDFQFSDGETGAVFIVTDVSSMIPEVREYVRDVAVAVIIILFITGTALVFWIYQSILVPLNKLSTATHNITEGNLDFQLEAQSGDELGLLCQDFEAMRLRLKDNAEEKLTYDRESKELISNISHDLKTPITAIKGYAEGIIDGVADTPEKQDKYIKTIYNKASEMDLLINELTLYSKVDTNRIPYNFSTLDVNAYFSDCAEDLSLELESKNIEFHYYNYITEPLKIIADPEQLKRVIHNIVNNSLKYMEKEDGKINLRIKDVGDYVQVELEDSGKGIAAKDLPNIFERFYRTDASRNSSKGGSGIGLSIVKKIIEEHGGKIWATSVENVGTTMYFVVRKYQEVPTNE